MLSLGSLLGISPASARPQRLHSVVLLPGTKPNLESSIDKVRRCNIVFTLERRYKYTDGLADVLLTNDHLLHTTKMIGLPSLFLRHN